MSSREHLYNQGNAALREEDYATAVALYDQSLAIDPAFDLAYYHRGLCRLYLDDAEGLVDLLTAARLACVFEPLYKALVRHGCQRLGCHWTFEILDDEQLPEAGRELILKALIEYFAEADYLDYLFSPVQPSGEVDSISLGDYCLLADGAAYNVASLPHVDRLDALIEALESGTRRDDYEIVWRAWYLLGVTAYSPVAIESQDIPDIYIPVAWSIQDKDMVDALLEVGRELEVDLSVEGETIDLARVAQSCFEEAGIALSERPTDSPDTWPSISVAEAEDQWALIEDVYREWVCSCAYLKDSEGLCDAIEYARLKHCCIMAGTNDGPLSVQLERIDGLFGPLLENESVVKRGHGELVIDMFVGEVVEDRILMAAVLEDEAIVHGGDIKALRETGDEAQQSILEGLLEANEAWIPEEARRALEREALASGNRQATVSALHRASFEDLPSRIDPKVDEALLGGARDAIESCRRLAIVPFNYLHNFPFHALPSIADRIHSGEIEALVYAPSLRTLVEPNGRNGGAGSERRTCLFVGCDIGSTLSIDQELEIVRESFADVEILVDREARKSWVLDALPEFDVVHFCCHGSLDLDARATFLQLADGRLFPSDVLTLESVPELVFANACISAAAARTGRNGDQGIGLHTAFLLTGARGVIGTLWKAHDDVALNLAAEFYARSATDPTVLPAMVFTESQRRLRQTYNELGMWAVHAYFGGLY